MRSWYDVQPGVSSASDARTPLIQASTRPSALSRSRADDGAAASANSRRSSGTGPSISLGMPMTRASSSGSADSRLDGERIAPLRPARAAVAIADREAAPFAALQRRPAPGSPIGLAPTTGSSGASDCALGAARELVAQLTRVGIVADDLPRQPEAACRHAEQSGRVLGSSAATRVDGVGRRGRGECRHG